ncbi:MAG: MFS transporter, partial [Anaerolineaceae bacterium]
MSRLTGLWRRPDFLKLWSGQTISLLGTQITLLAVPILAAVLLRATPAQMGILSALQLAPALLLGLVTNLWIDRLPRRPLMIAIDLLRALILLIIPVGGWMGFLSMPLLYGLGFLLGAANFLFTVLYRSYLPALVEKEDLVEANSKLEVSSALAEIAGPGF